MNKALEKSIYHWIMISHGLESERGIENCALCQEYYNDYCFECPVYIKTNEIQCKETPFILWGFHLFDYHGITGDDKEAFVHCDQCKKLALDEVGFLNSLI